MSAKHTPEPWKCVAAEFGEDGTENEGLVAFWVRMPKPCISMAHARLIAAAPELLEALREAEEALRLSYQVCDYPANGESIQDVALAKVRAAIARAEGGQP